MSIQENDYYKWIFLPANGYGMIHILQDKKKNEWFLVHATMTRFPATFKDGIVSGIITLGI
jgi:hypothetical protein